MKVEYKTRTLEKVEGKFGTMRLIVPAGLRSKAMTISRPRMDGYDVYICNPSVTNLENARLSVRTGCEFKFDAK